MEGSPVYERLSIESKIKKYDVDFLNEDLSIDRLVERLNVSESLSNVVFVVDDFLNGLINTYGHKTIFITSSETTKSYRGVEGVIGKLLDCGITKDTHLVAIGGGIVQDAVSFSASILFRGIKWSYVPTTLLSQGDSCIGSKTSINFESYKNQIGNFYPPEKVFIYPEFEKSLSTTEILSGMGEMLHYFLVSGEDDLKFFMDNMNNASKINIVKRSLMIKKKFIEIDEFEKKERKLLNYGHSFGHAIESMMDYAIPHGIAVAYGMDVANFTSMKLGFLSEADYIRYNKTLRNIYKVCPIKSIDSNLITSFLAKDKKNTSTHYGFILTKKAGDMFVHMINKNQDMHNVIDEWFSSIEKDKL